MSDSSSENKQWPDPKDYGLPFVEVLPIKSIGEETIVPEKELEVQTPEIAEEVIPENIAPELVVTDSIAEKEIEIQQAVESDPEPVVEEEQIEKEVVSTENKSDSKESIVNKPAEKPVEKKSNSWVVIVTILTVLVVSVIAWQLMSQDEDTSLSESQTVSQKSPTQESPKVEEIPVEPEIENPATEENQLAENQDSISNSNTSLEEPVETPQTGTTIDRSAAESLIRVSNKQERPQYFIVVGSLPNERMAISESAQYLDRVSSIYMILPYEDVKNYRLAIGSYGSFRRANEELNTIKDQYTEALWILKY